MKYTGYEIRQVCEVNGAIEWVSELRAEDVIYPFWTLYGRRPVSGQTDETHAEGIVDSRDFLEVAEVYEGITGCKVALEPGVTDYLDLPVSDDEDDETKVLLNEKSPEFAKLLAICHAAGADSQVTAGVCATLAVLTHYSGEYFVFKAALLRRLDAEIRKVLEPVEGVGA